MTTPRPKQNPRVRPDDREAYIFPHRGMTEAEEYRFYEVMHLNFADFSEEAWFDMARGTFPIYPPPKDADTAFSMNEMMAKADGFTRRVMQQIRKER